MTLLWRDMPFKHSLIQWDVVLLLCTHTAINSEMTWPRWKAGLDNCIAQSGIALDGLNTVG